jgi:OmcA/MtrC family decaheme c-type cytochrome
VVSHEIAADGTVKVRFKMTDPKGLPLDRTGVETPGTVSSSFVLARIPKSGDHYQSYTTRTKTSTWPATAGKRAKQAAADSGGTYQTIAVGEYVYTFATKLPADYERDATHSIGIYGSRNLSEFDLGTNYASAPIYSFLPAGGTVTKIRDVINTNSCNACHDEINFHGGSRRGLPTCVLCHTPAYSDVTNVNPETNETMDMAAMTHRIHAGSLLQSVQAGKPFFWVGNGNRVTDFSHVSMPSEINNCQKCHESTATQKDNWLKNPSRRTCGSCHDMVNFATGEGHVGLPQLSDNQCKNCHIPEGEIDFDASIKGAHRDPTESSLITGIVGEIVSIENTKAGEKPVVNFTVKDRKGVVLEAAKLNRVAFTMGGPTTDYGEGLPNKGGYVTESALNAPASGGVYRYTFTNAIPAGAKGTFSISMEARRQEIVLEGTQKQMTIQSGSPNSVKYFSVDGSAVVARRAVVDTKKCNDCHRQLSIHGENRNATEYCVVCHNARETDTARRPAANAPAESVDFSLMIHRIHAGNVQARDYTVYGFGNTPHNYNKVVLPSELSNCTNCHIAGTQFVPAKAGLLDKTDPRGLLTPVKPATAACTSCHTSTDAASHALANTSALGESCGACHGEGKTYSVSKVHASN